MCRSEAAGGKIKLWTQLDQVEAQALGQLENIAALPWVFRHVAVMPDVHFGKGATVGSVIAMKDALSPAAVGVDIGCGMGAMLLNLTAGELPDNLDAIRAQIERDIPVGFNSHSTDAPIHQDGWELMKRYKHLQAPNVHTGAQESRVWQQIGTLGGGNHFIELCIDTKDRVWLVLHSGSRNIGKTLAEHHIGIARGLAHNASLPDKDLAVFLRNTPEMQAYRNDLMWAQEYAYVNRSAMKDLTFSALRRFFPDLKELDWITCHHNYVSEETHFGEDVIVTRKGAISAEKGQMGIIPGSMGTKTYIVRGLGNPDSYHSASHGAGRRLSRGAAKRQFTVEDLAQQTSGVNCRKDAGVLDEIPSAYKDIDEVMENQKDLVEVVAQLKQVLCVKG
jgi:tRNA-splicing ligase RtcB (3'-phosphate/5'-hydroxy nucleic acid ligase)